MMAGSIMYETILFVGLDLYVCLPLKWDYVHGFLKIASTRARMWVSADSGFGRCFGPIVSAGADFSSRIQV